MWFTNTQTVIRWAVAFVAVGIALGFAVPAVAAQPDCNVNADAGIVSAEVDIDSTEVTVDTGINTDDVGDVPTTEQDCSGVPGDV